MFAFDAVVATSNSKNREKKPERLFYNFDQFIWKKRRETEKPGKTYI